MIGASATAVVTRVNGPVIEVSAGDALAMLDLVRVGPQRLPGEVIALGGASATVQVYEYTGGLKPGDEVFSTGAPLTVELGPGLLGGVFDGVLRALGSAGTRIEPGGAAETLGADRAWKFIPVVEAGELLTAGAVLGTVGETTAIDHRVLVPPHAEGQLEWIAPAGDYRVTEVVARVGGAELALAQRWPVRRPRPVSARLPAVEPLVTGQRVLDLLFPIARGSTAAIPGGFGTGKTVALQQIAKWCDAAVIVYVGCGERGNELADVLEEFEALEDPRTGQSLLDRTVLIANTSNMPVMAREASVYTGVTVAEYYRDMGLDAVVIADSTSRWAEALRELASRTDELPSGGGLSGGPRIVAGRFLRARRPGEDARRRHRVGERARRRLASGGRSDRARDLAHAAVRALRCGRLTVIWPTLATTRPSAGATPPHATRGRSRSGRPSTAIRAGVSAGRGRCACSPTPTGSSRSPSSWARTRCRRWSA